MKPIYLDHAAATPLDPSVLEAMQPYLGADFANPSSLYSAARRPRQAIDEARALVARILGAKPTEIIFTSGGSESINLAIQGAIYLQSIGSHWVTTTIEHDAVLAQREPLERAGYPSTTIPVKSSGEVDPTKVLEAITDKTVLVSLQLANNEIGTIQPVAEVAKGIAEIRADRQRRNLDRALYLHTDAVAAANYCDLSVARLGIDLLSLSGSKIYGPRVVAYCMCGPGLRLSSRSLVEVRSVDCAVAPKMSPVSWAFPSRSSWLMIQG